MTSLSRLNKSSLIERVTEVESQLHVMKEQRTALVVVLAITIIVNLLF
jgi:hypothetical protein